MLLAVTLTNTRKSSTTLVPSTITSTCRPIVTKVITSTRTATTITSYSTVVRTVIDSTVTSSFVTSKVVTASCIFSTASASGLASYTISGSACVAGFGLPWLSGATVSIGPFPTAIPGDRRAPPWGYYGPPPWITSAWAANAGRAPWISCSPLPALAPSTAVPAKTTGTVRKAPKETSRPRRQGESQEENSMKANVARAVGAATTVTLTQTTYTATEWATQFAPSLTLTRLGE